MRKLLRRTVTCVAAILVALSFIGAASAHDVMASGEKSVSIQRVAVPAHPRLRAMVQIALQAEVEVVRAAVQKRHALSISHIRWSSDQVVVIGHRLVRDGNSARAPMWLEEVRVTVPRHYLASTWDVRSLQKELERLGIKVKPKPTAPKPTLQISG